MEENGTVSSKLRFRVLKSSIETFHEFLGICIINLEKHEKASFSHELSRDPLFNLRGPMNALA